MMTDERKPILVRLDPVLIRKVERLTRKSRKEMGGSWSRNDQICWMLKMYEAPDLARQPPPEEN